MYELLFSVNQLRSIDNRWKVILCLRKVLYEHAIDQSCIFFCITDIIIFIKFHSLFGSGTAGDSLIHHNGYPFTTKDQDNDHRSSSNCSVEFTGAWWYGNCYYSNLNGIYHPKHYSGTNSTNWYPWKNSYDSLKRAEMKMRPVNF